ncbi:hypothetical protein, partial [Enterobacter kobei]|uniref:hypothetical protein n=1 Tax=Enterobacter kobei TaxID=208224 RepID=UPI0020752604
VHGGDLWRLNTPLSCLQPPQQGKTHECTVAKLWRTIQHDVQITSKVINLMFVIHSIHIRVAR